MRVWVCVSGYVCLGMCVRLCMYMLGLFACNASSLSSLVSLLVVHWLCETELEVPLTVGKPREVTVKSTLAVA